MSTSTLQSSRLRGTPFCSASRGMPPSGATGSAEGLLGGRCTLLSFERPLFFVVLLDGGHEPARTLKTP
jgi:hypothetical protein